MMDADAYKKRVKEPIDHSMKKTTTNLTISSDSSQKEEIGPEHHSPQENAEKLITITIAYSGKEGSFPIENFQFDSESEGELVIDESSPTRDKFMSVDFSSAHTLLSNPNE